MKRLHQTREEAIKWHRKMWEEMRIVEGDDCYVTARVKFKQRYVEKNFPDVEVTNNCFLCNYAVDRTRKEIEKQVGYCYDLMSVTGFCKFCPLKWGHIDNHFDCEDEYSGVNWTSDSCLLIAGLEERTGNI